MKKHARILDVRKPNGDDLILLHSECKAWGVKLPPLAYVAIDSDGHRFWADSETDAREQAEAFNFPRKRIKRPKKIKTDDIQPQPTEQTT